jgi:hypothetical protein
VCLCTCGQSGSGKTFTLSGRTYSQSEKENPHAVDYNYFKKQEDREDQGLAVRVLNELYNQVYQVPMDRQKYYHIFLSYFCVNNGRTREMTDLLKPQVGPRTRHKVYKN